MVVSLLQLKMIDMKKTWLKAALEGHPEIKPIQYLGDGNRGEAHLTNKGFVLKMTLDEDEYSTAQKLQGKKLQHIIDIYDCWEAECNDKYSDNFYCILEEYVNTKEKGEIIQKFVSEFKHAWYSLYFPIYEHIYGTYDDLDRYMKDPTKYSNAITFVKQHIIDQGRVQGLGIVFESIFDQLLSAYAELLKHSPKSRIDINDGNIGFGHNGVLKVFDIQ